MSERGVSTHPESPVEVKKFSQKAREALEKQGFVIYSLTGQSIKSLRDAGRQFWSTWHKDLPEFEALCFMHSEIAINPDKLYLPKSNYKTLAQQEEMIERFSQELGEKVEGVRAVIGQVSDYVELAFAYFDTTKKDLFGSKHSYDYARTKTPTSGSYVANVGRFIGNDGLRLAYWNADDGYDGVHAVPLIVPV